MKITENTEKRIEELIKEMSLEEKVSLCHANSKFTVAAIERLGIGELTMSDGPHGVRAELERDGWACLNRPEDDCTYLPTGTALAATWNPKLAKLFGETLGEEARARGKDIILGPGVNIIRNPLCGRNFEYFSEDPELIAAMGPEVVKGIESTSTAACVKHYVLNNQELDRFKVNVEVSRRALHEIYLKGFYHTIMDGEASSVMGAYNKYEGQYCCHNDYLVNKVLKEKWGFKGVYLTDWGGAHDTEEAVFNGLDIEMGTNKPYNEYYLADGFLALAKENKEAVKVLDDKVRRILRLIFSIGKFNPNRYKGEFNTQKHQKACYDIATEAMVLLKNDDNVLPIDKASVKNILVVGPNATIKHAAGGNSSGVHALYEITSLEGIQNRFGDTCHIEYESGVFTAEYSTIPIQNLNIVDMVAGCRDFKQTAYTVLEDGTENKEISFRETANIKNGKADKYEVFCSVTIPEDGAYSFKFDTNSSAVIKICGKEYANIYKNKWNPTQVFTCGFDYKKGDVVDIDVSIQKSPEEDVAFNFGWLTPSESNVSSKNDLFKKAEKADYVIYCGGIDHSLDSESLDKRTMRLPSEQDVLIPQLAEINKNTVVVLTAGSPVSMPWIDKVNAVIWGWYAGMEGGNVLADILSGSISPSGKMPFTLPKDYADTPVARYGEYKTENCRYNEDIFVGYRGYEHDNIEPLFPFGHGLTYSKFDLKNMEVSVKDDTAYVSLDITNSGSVEAAETVQIYLGDPVCSVMRPVKELKCFQKVKLSAGETKKLNFKITAYDMSFVDEKTENWKFERGEFTVFAGFSTKDIRLTDKYNI